jgi:hypothetical protein
MNRAMMINVRKVTPTLGADDALLLLGHLRGERARFEQAGNEVMAGMLERVDEALDAVLTPRKP